jgi:hypothetical protein
MKNPWILLAKAVQFWAFQILTRRVSCDLARKKGVVGLNISD